MSSDVSNLSRRAANKLFKALRFGDTDIVAANLTDFQLDVNAQIFFWSYLSHPELGLPGCTCLHAAAYTGSVPSVKYLLEAGAKPDALDGVDRTALDVTSNETVKEILLSHMSISSSTNHELVVPAPAASAEPAFDAPLAAAAHQPAPADATPTTSVATQMPTLSDQVTAFLRLTRGTRGSSSVTSAGMTTTMSSSTTSDATSIWTLESEPRKKSAEQV